MENATDQIANPYAPPRGGIESDGPVYIISNAERIEKAVIITAFVYLLVYIPYFVYRITNEVPVSPLEILPAHFVCMTLNLIALVLTIRDLYLRTFPSPNTKMTWLLLILLTGGIGWIVYVFRYALKPRAKIG